MLYLCWLVYLHSLYTGFFNMIHDLPILSILIWLPILMGFVSLLVGAESNKKQFFLISISNVTFFLCTIILLLVFLSFDVTDVNFQFTESYSGPGLKTQTIIQRTTQIQSVTNTTSQFSN